MKQIARRQRSRIRNGRARFIALGLALGLTFGVGFLASPTARAARVASDLRQATGDPKPPTPAPAPPVPGMRLAELAARVAAQRSAASASTAAAAASTQSVPTSVPGNPLLDPSTYLNPIMKSNLVKDLEHLVSINHGRMSNLNQQSMNSLASDLGIRLPRNVAPHPSASASASKRVLEAQVLDPSGTTGTASLGPAPAPVPEPGTLAIFGLSALALSARSRLGRRSA